MLYHWTNDEAETLKLAEGANGIEIAGCHDLGDSIERVEGSECEGERCDGVPDADFYSVYFHFDPEWSNDPNRLHGSLCIADRDTADEARAHAAELASRFGLPVYDYA